MTETVFTKVDYDLGKHHYWLSPLYQTQKIHSRHNTNLHNYLCKYMVVIVARYIEPIEYDVGRLYVQNRYNQRRPFSLTFQSLH